ncbi:MAG TPA: hypothetical protein VE987_13490 [Polyangiaceae bacterium]|nr:hypothetical protein [Polyangiaceae bacterium]
MADRCHHVVIVGGGLAGLSAGCYPRALNDDFAQVMLEQIERVIPGTRELVTMIGVATATARPC